MCASRRLKSSERVSKWVSETCECVCSDLTFLSMYSTSEGRLEFCTSNSVRSASSREGGGSLGCRVGGSFLMRRILKHKHTIKRIMNTKHKMETAPSCQTHQSSLKTKTGIIRNRLVLKRDRLTLGCSQHKVMRSDRSEHKTHYFMLNTTLFFLF